MQISDAMQIAEKIVEDAEAQGFNNTADAMRLVLKEMALVHYGPRAKSWQTEPHAPHYS